MVGCITMPLIESFLDGPLGTFLRSRHVDKGETCSLTGMGNIKGRWMVKDEDYPQFINLMNDYLFVQKRRPLNLVEQRRCDGYSPILIDLDFKYTPESAIERRFSLSNIRAFIRNYINSLTHFYDLNNHKPIRFFICLRPAPYEDKKIHGSRSIKDGVHIECPDLILHSDHQQVLRHRSLEIDALTIAFEGTGYINSEKDIFDETIVKKTGWFFYGESKPDIPAYTLASVYVYDPVTGEFDDQEPSEYTSHELLESLSIRYNLIVEKLAFNQDVANEWQERLDACVGLKKDNIIINDSTGGDVAESSVIPTWLSQGHTSSEVELAKKLALQCLSADRANNYSSWMEVGWCLHSIDPSEEMFNVWMQFSDKSGKSSDNNINLLARDWVRGWGHRGNQRQFTIRSLHLWAKHDNKNEYKKIMEEDNINFVERHVDATHTHIARLMHKIYWGDYRCAVDSKRSEWYEYNGNCWRRLSQGIEIRNKMSTEVADAIDKARQIARRRLISSKEGTIEYNFEQARLKKYMQIEKNLYTSGFKDSVMKECIGLFYEDEFAQKLNSNQFLIGFANGVVDLRAERVLPNGQKEYHVQFRDGKPNDYITFMAGRWLPKQCDPISYVPYDPTDPHQQQLDAEIDDFMAKVFPRRELREFMWRKFASCLEGTNREQTYDTFIGQGGNGKSKIIDLISMVLGDYVTSLQSTAMTRKRPESGAANPDIMAIRNKRFIYMAEPDDREPLNTSRMKQFTGEDVVEARGLFEDQMKFQITGKMFMLCNALPMINAHDGGVWRRVRVIPFESRFVEPNSPEIDPSKNIYPRDNALDMNLKRWRVQFMSRLVHVYETQYLKNGLEPVPAIIKQESSKYREMSDSFGKFKGARIREEVGSEARLPDIWRIYKNWVEANGAGGRRLTQGELQRRLDDEFGTPQDKKTYRRVHLFDSDEDIEEYDQNKAN